MCLTDCFGFASQTGARPRALRRPSSGLSIPPAYRLLFEGKRWRIVPVAGVAVFQGSYRARYVEAMDLDDNTFFPELEGEGRKEAERWLRDFLRLVIRIAGDHRPEMSRGSFDDRRCPSGSDVFQSVCWRNPPQEL